jgi:hypothetical protein
VPPPGAAAPVFSADQLNQLVGPIALYPDPLTAEILPAATFPSQITLADRYLTTGGDPNQIPDQGWDPSVQALAHYPNVLKWMDDNLGWTTQLGQAFMSQQADVMNAIQQLRSQAQQLGNLPSTPQQTVSTDQGDIEIMPTDPDQLYVPSYDPGVIFYQPGIYCTFPFWLPVGGWLCHDWDWRHRGLITWGAGYTRPGNWWRESPGARHSYINGHSMPVWRGGGGVGGGGHPAWARGYETPREAAPRVNVARSAPEIRRTAPLERQAPVERREAPVARPEIRSAPSASIFGGQSGREAVESSSRGQASRATMGGGGGGGGGAAAGGGRHR